jgi:hypothetical protein
MPSRGNFSNFSAMLEERRTRRSASPVWKARQRRPPMLGVQDIRLDQFRSNVLALAKTAKAHDLPTVITGSHLTRPNGPVMPELLEILPNVLPIIICLYFQVISA